MINNTIRIAIYIISIISSISSYMIGLKLLKKIPNEQHDQKWNLRRLDLYSGIGILIDFLFSIIIIIIIPHELNGNGFEIISASLVVVVFLIVGIYHTKKIKRRMNKYSSDRFRRSNCLIHSAFMKGIFTILITISLEDIF